MADKTFRHGLTVGKAAELEMRKWALGLQVQDQLKKQTPPEELPSQIHAYLALSREVGAGGSEPQQAGARVRAQRAWRAGSAYRHTGVYRRCDSDERRR